MSNDRFCVDCKHCRIVHIGKYKYAMCQSPDAGKDPVTGDDVKTTCRKARDYGSMCGQDGKWFELRGTPNEVEPIQKPEPPPTTETRPSRPFQEEIPKPDWLPPAIRALAWAMAAALLFSLIYAATK